MPSKLPTCLIGFVKGPVRWELCGGGALYEGEDKFILFQGAEPWAAPAKTEKFAITHLQKKSKFGFLLMWPLCFHIWFTFKFQEKNSFTDAWVPGSEKVLYWRVGWTRWDAGDCKYVMGWTRQIFGIKIRIPFGTWYGPGLHWD